MLKEIDKKELIKYIKSLGLIVNTGTKARGHKGFFLENRIDISKELVDDKIIPVLLHEFTHYIHYKIEPEMNKTGGTFRRIFNSDNPIYSAELDKVTQFVDENSRLMDLYKQKNNLKEKILLEESVIKGYFPKFKRSAPFKPLEKIIKKTDMKYLLKYDRVKIWGGNFTFKTRIISVEDMEKDFKGAEIYIYSYIRLKSYQRMLNKISSRINRYKKYYSKPAEKFARFVEGLYLDEEWIEAIAPESVKKFYELLNDGYYGELKNVITK